MDTSSAASMPSISSPSQLTTTTTEDETNAVPSPLVETEPTEATVVEENEPNDFETNNDNTATAPIDGHADWFKTEQYQPEEVEEEFDMNAMAAAAPSTTLEKEEEEDSTIVNKSPVPGLNEVVANKQQKSTAIPLGLKTGKGKSKRPKFRAKAVLKSKPKTKAKPK